MCGYRGEGRPTRANQEGVKRETEFGEFPWMIEILEREEFIASGVLIGRDIVLTSASKLDGKNLVDIRVRAGVWNMQSNEEMYPPQSRLVEKIIPHEDFKNNKKYNNIALLQLKIRFSDVVYIKPICLTDSLKEIDQNRCLVTSWEVGNPYCDPSP